MSWRDSLGPATFRGAKFYVESSDRSGGRRQVKHQFPFKDKPSFDDMGMAGRTFPLEGFVLGDDYMADRDALLDALEGEGPGVLIHPYYGNRRVVVLTYRVREEATRGGMAHFTIEFDEAPLDSLQPSVAPDVTGAAQDAASSAADAVQAQFTADYVPGVRTESLQGILTSVQSSVQSALLGVTLGEQALATVGNQVAELVSDVSTLVSAPADLFGAVSTLIGQFQSGTESVLYALYNFDPGLRPPSTTPGRIQEQGCFDALQLMVQRLALVQLASVAIVTSFDSYDEAIATRDSITSLLDDQADLSADDTYPAMTTLRATVVEAVPGAGKDLPHLVQYTPLVTVPSLVLAHRLYGSVDQELDLVSRNQISDPTRVTGGVALEVLSDG